MQGVTVALVGVRCFCVDFENCCGFVYYVFIDCRLLKCFVVLCVRLVCGSGFWLIC